MTLFIEIFYLLVFGVIVMVLIILALDKFFTGKTQDVLFCCCLIAFMLFVVQHIYMSISLGNIKNEFVSVARSGPTHIELHVNDNGESYRTADYSGAIDKVLKKRNTLLTAKHYKKIGPWRIQSYAGKEISTSTVAIYVWLPFL